MNAPPREGRRSRGNNPRGRPPLADPERIEIALKAVRKGLNYKLSAAFAGVSYDTFNRWRRLAMSDSPPPELCHFCEALREAEGEAAYKFVSRIDAASEKDWRAAAWMLERRHPENWASNRKEHDPVEGFELHMGL